MNGRELAERLTALRPGLPIVPDSPETVTLRTSVRARKDLVGTRGRLTQQLTAHLELVFPGAVGLFADLDSPIALRFLLRFPSAAKAAWLGPKRMAAWLRAEGYPGRTSADELCRRLAVAPLGAHRPGGRGPGGGHARLRPGPARRPRAGGRPRGPDRSRVSRGPPRPPGRRGSTSR
ncbi:MAG: hypothetical protein WCH74_10760, partial [Chloroflexota bacterium]